MIGAGRTKIALYIMPLLDGSQGSSSRRIKRENRMTDGRQFHPMGRPRMAKLAAIAIVLLACSITLSRAIRRESDPWKSIEKRTLATGERNIPLETR